MLRDTHWHTSSSTSCFGKVALPTTTRREQSLLYLILCLAMERKFAGETPAVNEAQTRIVREVGSQKANSRLLSEAFAAEAEAEEERQLTKRQRRSYPDGYCKIRAERGWCGCIEARLPQKCQACNSDIEKGHCIKYGGGGWVHVRCRGDELRESEEVLTDAFIPQAPSRAALEAGPAQKAVGLLKSGREQDDDEASVAGDSENDSDYCEDDGDDIKPSASCFSATGANIVTQSGPSSGESSYESDGEDGLGRLTKEQRRIVEHQPSQGDVIRIDALAGCGKTTTCAFLSRQVNERIGDGCKQLYVVFNNSAMAEARASHKFPKNCDIRTSHSLAKRMVFGTQSFFKVDNSFNRDAIIQQLRLMLWVNNTFPRVDTKTKERIAKTIVTFVIRSLNNFLHSSDQNVTVAHVTWEATVSPKTDRSKWKEKISKAQYAAWTRTVFSVIHEQCNHEAGRISKMANPNVGITHDVYLKYLQLHQHEYSFSYELIIVDEAQDMTPCQADLLWGTAATKNAAIYLVGDENQRLYRFRGARDSFETTAVTEAFPLTGSFRFGKKIADAASLVLGVSTSSRLQGFSADPGKKLSGEHFEQGVVICRSRNGMLRYLETHQPKKWTFLSERQKLPDTSSVLLPLEIFYLEKTKQYTYRRERFSRWEDLADFAEEEADRELMNNMAFVEDFHSRHEGEEGATIGAIFEQIREKWVRDWRKQQKDEEIPDINRFGGVVLATCHAAKGLEFDNVYLYDDFGFDTLMKIEGYVSSQYLKEMLNLVYVAVTRAKKRLFLSSKARDFLSWAKVRENEEAEQGWEDSDGEDSDGAQAGSEKGDLKRARDLLEEEWNQFLERRDSEVKSLNDIPFPEGPKDNEFALCSSMSISEQRSYIKTYLLRYNKFFPSFGRKLALGSNASLQTLEEKINEVCRICNGLWRALREQD